MTQLAVPAPRAVAFTPALFAGAVFMSAALVFLVQPMMGKLILPLLGGSAAVWNTSLAFFQTALLGGYGYAHLLQRRVRSVRTQSLIHVLVLAAAALVLPLRLSTLMSDPPAGGQPALWLVGVLALSIGAPFAVLSATAPLLQAWYARLRFQGGTEAPNPYGLYAASNLGSLLALAAYPAFVEPLLTLSAQRTLWSGGYGLFVAAAAGLALMARTGTEAAPSLRASAGLATPWRTRLTWVALAALPSSLMLGVTSHITTDVASAPFLWVAPLALYLLTFVIAFQERPWITPSAALLLQAGTLAVCAVFLPLRTSSWPALLAVHLSAFFFSALVCHQALAARRPEPARLTDFYLMMSVGGVIGGAFNAFVAPLIFNQVWEYPLALVLAGLARPWTRGQATREERILLGGGLLALVATLALGRVPAVGLTLGLTGLGTAAGAAMLLRRRTSLFVLMIAAVILVGEITSGVFEGVEVRRSFFGVHRVTTEDHAGPGKVRMLFHGTTLHGSQMLDPQRRCTPTAYYAPAAPIGQAFTAVLARKPAARIAAVGLGAGAVAAYVRPADRLRFFELDPAVLHIARDSGQFSYLGACARGPVDYVLGDARLTLGREPEAAYDLLLVDAFASDSVPTHLLTVEALRLYLGKLKPDGVLVLHLTNRNLQLEEPAAAVVREAGAYGLVQAFQPTPAMGKPPEIAASTALVAARTPEALAAFAHDPRWSPAEAHGARAWTDDYTNILGALLAHMRKG